MKRVNLTAYTPEPITGHTSKGDQPKWQRGNVWYKGDHMGTEALSEILVTMMLEHSNIEDFVAYEPVLIGYNEHELRGCVSENFKGKDETLVPFEKLHRAYKGIGLAQKLAAFPDAAQRIQYTVDFIEGVTGLTQVGAYLTTILELDAFTLNEDRHTNNLAVIRNEKTMAYRLCPIFDNGLALLSDLNDYPLDADIYQCMDRVHAKPFAYTFDEQVEAAEMLYGSHLAFHFRKADVYAALKKLEELYSPEILQRAERVVLEQMRRWSFYF